MLFSFSLFPLITKPNRITETTSTLIDHTGTNHIEDNIRNYIIETDKTDHFSTIAQFQFECNLHEPRFIYKRSITNYSVENFNAELRNFKWNDVLTFSTCNDAFNTLFILYDELCEVYFPVKRIL